MGETDYIMPLITFVVGGGAYKLAAMYFVYRRKISDDNTKVALKTSEAEAHLRNELRDDLRILKEEIKNLKEERDDCRKQLNSIETRCIRLEYEVEFLKTELAKKGVVS